MVGDVLIVALLLSVFVMAALAAVLVVALFAGRESRGRKIAIAAIGGPGFVSILVGLAVVLDEGFVIERVAVLLAGSVLVMAMIGWPIAYFATRRLERVTRWDTSTFD